MSLFVELAEYEIWAYSFAKTENLILSIVAGLIIFAVAYYIVIYFRDAAKNQTVSEPTGEELLKNFNQIYENGDLTSEEFCQIKRRLTDQIVEELQKKTKPIESPLKTSLKIKTTSDKEREAILKTLLSEQNERRTER